MKKWNRIDRDGGRNGGWTDRLWDGQGAGDDSGC